MLGSDTLPNGGVPSLICQIRRAVSLLQSAYCTVQQWNSRKRKGEAWALLRLSQVLYSEGTSPCRAGINGWMYWTEYSIHIG